MDESLGLLSGPPVVINVGARDFGTSIEEQGAQVVYVDWSPPAGGDQELIDLLDQLM